MTNKLSLLDRKFLAACKISAEPLRYSDFSFLKACGVDPTLTPEEYRDANMHRDISPCRDCAATTFQQHAKTCRHRVALGDTVQSMAALGIPITRENYLRLAFAGNPPTPPFDGELAEALPDWVRRAFEGED
jgi:hypothetical protein